jgi:HAMP domain-containing protein
MLWLRSGLLRRFAATMVALALLPAALLALQLINISRRGIQAAVLELHTGSAETLAERVDEFRQTTNQKIRFALASLRKNLDWTEKQDLLQALIETHPDIVEISVVDAKGRELVKVYNPDQSSDETLRSRADEPAFRRHRAEGGRASSVSRVGDRAFETVYYPVTDKIAARVHLALGALRRRIEAARFGGTGFSVLVDGDGTPLLFPPEKLDAKTAEAFRRWPIVTAALQAQSVGSSEFRDEASGVAYVGAYAPVDTGGAIVTLQSREEAYSAANAMKRTAVLAVVIVVLLAGLAGFWEARKLTTPLISLSRAAEAVSRGDFLAKVDIATGDELQDLADTFNRMTAQLRAYSVLQVDRLIAEQRKTEAILSSISDGIGAGGARDAGPGRPHAL